MNAGGLDRTDLDRLGGAVFLFLYPSVGDTFRFPALSACCSGELRARGIASVVVEAVLDVSDQQSRARALDELSVLLRRAAPAVVIPEDVFDPSVFGVIRNSCDARIVCVNSPDSESAPLIDYVVERFETNPRPLIDLVESLARGLEPTGIPNVVGLGATGIVRAPACAPTPMFEAVPDYDFIQIPSSSPRSGRRLSVYVNPGCPWSADASRNPEFLGVDLSDPGLSRHGCSFCLQDGEYSGLDAESTVDRILLELDAWRALNPDCNELVIWDESPWRFLPLLVESVAVRSLGPLTICFHARCDHLVRQSGVIVEACRAARRHPRSEVSLALTLVGFENYSQAELDRMNKGYRSADLSAAVQACRRLADDYPEVFEFDRFRASSFILFTPWTTVDDLRANIAGFSRDCMTEFSTGMGRTKLRLYPDLPIFRLALRDGLVDAARFDDELNASRRFGYSVDLPWRFRDPAVEKIFRLHEALYPVVERNEQVDLLAWCVDAVVDGDGAAADAGVFRSLFVRLNDAVRRLNDRAAAAEPRQCPDTGAERGDSDEKPRQVDADRQARQTDSDKLPRRAGTLEIFLSGRGVPDGRCQPDLSCDPSPGRLAVRISRMADRIERIHILGREPSLSPIFLRAVYLARQAGVAGATVRTDGLVFAEPSALAKAIKAGVTDIEIRVFGVDNDSWRRATCGRGDISTFRRAASLLGASSAALNGRALIELGMVAPAAVPSVLELIASTGLGSVSYECPVSCIPRSGLDDFVNAMERLANG